MGGESVKQEVGHLSVGLTSGETRVAQQDA
jgi:hypothetical protein